MPAIEAKRQEEAQLYPIADKSARIDHTTDLRNICLNIGAGKIEDVISIAQRYPDNNHVALDPSYNENPVQFTPDNVFLKKWGFSRTSPIPFGDATISRIYAFFLMGEIAETGWDREEAEAYTATRPLLDLIKIRYGEDSTRFYDVMSRTQIIYKRMMNEFARVLKDGGSLEIYEPYENAQLASPIAGRCSFDLVSSGPLERHNNTTWSGLFNNLGDSKMSKPHRLLLTRKFRIR